MLPFAVEHDGFAIAKDVVAEAERRLLLDVLGDPRRAGARGVLAVPAVRAFARSEAIESLVSAHLGARPIPVRAIFFDKSSSSNWLVPWHQDLTIAVASKCEAPGFGPWSVKDGIPHVQSPESLLKQMIALRLHLDDCDAANGALRVIPGSHKSGRLNPGQISNVRASSAEMVCEASAGDVLLMRPLLLHASSKSVSNRRRRILHIEYCCGELPAGMTWHESS
jgi:ectoine hydroxylase-related dioxygenase (phytanoyl-CoA dioxygenase family)